jgi:hypothetical protein
MSPADRARLAALLMSGVSGVKGEATPQDTPDTHLPGFAIERPAARELPILQ